MEQLTNDLLEEKTKWTTIKIKKNVFLQMIYLVKQYEFIPIIKYEDLHFLLLGIYQLRIVRYYLRDCYEALCFYRYFKGNKKYESIKVVNTRSRFEKTLRELW